MYSILYCIHLLTLPMFCTNTHHRSQHQCSWSWQYICIFTCLCLRQSFEKLTSGTTCIDLSSIAVKRVWSRDAIFLVWYAVHDLHIYPLHEKQKFVACSSSFSLEQSSQCISFGWSTIFYSMVFSGKSSTHVCVYKGSPSLGMLTRQSGQRNPKRGSVDLHWLIM